MIRWMKIIHLRWVTSTEQASSGGRKQPTSRRVFSEQTAQMFLPNVDGFMLGLVLHECMHVMLVVCIRYAELACKFVTSAPS